MSRNITVSAFAILLFAFLMGCGTSDPSTSNANRVLQSITVSPATADAQNFPDGQVQFTATGTFSRPPSPAPVPFVSPYSGGWTVSDPVIATINQSGMAQCTFHASGEATVTAMASANSCPNRGCMSIAVLGTAKLICP
jgi:hypothetical protein